MSDLLLGAGGGVRGQPAVVLIWSKFMGKNGLIAIGACESFLLSTNE